ncbi:MAG: sugar kinase [Thermoanaerobaculia bacterium]
MSLPAAGPRPFLVVGDAFADLSARVSRFPEEGSDAHARRIDWSSGGSAANVAAALAALGSPVRLVARVGADPAAVIALRAARRAGVDLSLVQDDPVEPTGLCFVVVSASGERTFFSARGANENLAPPEGAAALLDGAPGLHVSGYALLGGSRAAALALAGVARERGVPVSLDLCLPLVDARRDETLALLPLFSVVFGNDREVSLLAGGDVEDGVRAIVARGVEVAVAKTGEKGCFVASRDGASTVAGHPVEAVDTTGCGDAFVAGFLHSRARGAPLRLCGALGNALGALAATSPGSGDALPGPDSIRAFLAGRAAGLLPLLSASAREVTT